MAGSNPLFYEHGRTAVNGGSREPARSHSPRSSADIRDPSRSHSHRSSADIREPSRSHFHRSSGGSRMEPVGSYSHRSIGGILMVPQRSHSGHEYPSRSRSESLSHSYREEPRIITPSSMSRSYTYPSQYLSSLTEGVSVANGHRVRVATPDQFPGLDMRDWTLDQLNQEFARVCKLYPEQMSKFVAKPGSGSSPRLKEYRPDGSERSVRDAGRSMSRQELVRAVTTARAIENESRSRRG